MTAAGPLVDGDRVQGSQQGVRTSVPPRFPMSAGPSFAAIAPMGLGRRPEWRSPVAPAAAALDRR